MRAYAFQAVLVDDLDQPIVRTIAVREDQTLEQLHEALRLAFGWAEPHLYSFWIGQRFWDENAPEYTAPFELDEAGKGKRSARTPIAELGLRRGRYLAYVFDFGDEWRLLLRVEDVWEAGDDCYPMLVDAHGTRRRSTRITTRRTKRQTDCRGQPRRYSNAPMSGAPRRRRPVASAAGA
jgi:Plasmid pRiA4b ORF-3-like protein